MTLQPRYSHWLLTNLCKGSSSRELKLSDNDRLSIAKQLLASDSSIDFLWRPLVLHDMTLPTSTCEDSFDRQT